MGALISLVCHKIALLQFQVNAEPRTRLTRTYFWDETQIPVWRGHSQFLFCRSSNHVQLFSGEGRYEGWGGGGGGLGVMEKRERLPKEWRSAYSLFLASTWALIRGGGRQRGECHNSHGLTPGGGEYWASTLACHSFPGVCSLTNK